MGLIEAKQEGLCLLFYTFGGSEVLDVLFDLVFAISVSPDCVVMLLVKFAVL